MHTDSWIERVIIQDLSVHDRRYKHNYRSRQESTPGFVVGCGYIETMDRGADIRPSFGQSFDVEQQLEPDVKDALRTLHRQDLITKVRELPGGGLFTEDDLGATEQWELTEKGLEGSPGIECGICDGTGCVRGAVRRTGYDSCKRVNQFLETIRSDS
jgi:hypothetical protein